MQEYTIQTKLGEGAFAVVYKVKRKEDGKEYAMKKIRISNLSEKEIANCLNEVRLLASINSPYILSYRDSFYDQLTSTFCIITEFLEGGDLYNFITKHKMSRKLVEEEAIWKIAFQILRGLSTLHSLNVLHRDIKSANIFLTGNHHLAKLGDMNVSIASSNGMARTQTGTPYYASPEVWNDKPYNSKCDIWSLGCVLYEMAAQKPPFISPDLRSLKKTIVTGIYKRIPSTYSDELEQFIRMCLRVDTKSRPSANELLDHKAFKDHITKEGNSQERLKDFMNNSKLLEKIQPPRKRDFKIIKERLPHSKFILSSSCDGRPPETDESNKQNISINIYSSKISRKDELPAIIRSTSLVRESKAVKPSLLYEKPPLPKKLPR